MFQKTEFLDSENKGSHLIPKPSLLYSPEKALKPHCSHIFCITMRTLQPPQIRVEECNSTSTISPLLLPETCEHSK